MNSIFRTVAEAFCQGLTIDEILQKYGFKRRTVETYYSECRMKYFEKTGKVIE